MKNRQILNVWHAIFQPVDISWTKEKEGVIAWKREIEQKREMVGDKRYKFVEIVYNLF